MVQLRFHDDPTDFLAAAGEYLAADPVLCTVVNSVSRRCATELAAGIPDWRAPDAPALWWLTVHDADERVVGAGMRTMPSPPYPPYLLPMPAEAAVALARELHARGESLTAVNGTTPAAEQVAAETARLVGGRIRVSQQHRLFEVREVIPPATAPPGRLRPAELADLALVRAWLAEFPLAAGRQSGEAPDPAMAFTEPEAATALRIEATRLWLWEDPAGQVVHLTGTNPPADGVARIGPVYTPDDQRGHGYASAAVAQVSRLLLADGARVCLFTDQANAVSNALYRRLGYRPVADTANYAIEA